MKICKAMRKAREEQKAIRRKDWPVNIAWYHGMDNTIRWWNDDPTSSCVHKMGDEVRFAVADFWNKDYELHQTVPYHGSLIDEHPNDQYEI